MRRNLLSKVIKRPAGAAITLALASSATVCLASTQGQTKQPKPALHHTNYYHDKLGNSDSQIQWAPVGSRPVSPSPLTPRVPDLE
jgi:hypothetical protein